MAERCENKPVPHRRLWRRSAHRKTYNPLRSNYQEVFLWGGGWVGGEGFGGDKPSSVCGPCAFFFFSSSLFGQEVRKWRTAGSHSMRGRAIWSREPEQNNSYLHGFGPPVAAPPCLPASTPPAKSSAQISSREKSSRLRRGGTPDSRRHCQETEAGVRVRDLLVEWRNHSPSKCNKSLFCLVVSW